MRNPPQPRHHVEERSHVRRFFLHPHNVARLGVPPATRRQLRLRKRIHLLQENNRRLMSLRVLRSVRNSWPILPLQTRIRFACAIPRSRNHRQNADASKSSNGDERIRMPQHALGREHDQRLPPLPQRLPP